MEGLTSPFDTSDLGMNFGRNFLERYDVIFINLKISSRLLKIN